MKLLSLFKKNGNAPYVPLWSMQLHGEAICYYGEDILDFLKKFDHLEDHIINLWDVNAEWKYNRKGLIQKVAVSVLVTTAVIALLSKKKKSL